MKIEVFPSYEDLSLHAKNILVNKLRTKADLLLCAATGGSPTRLYELLVEENKVSPNLYSSMKVIKLDEWGGLPMQHPGTCESYLQKHLIQPLAIPTSRYISLLSNPAEPLSECERVQQSLGQEGPIDVCILGLGMNGHIALNEPAEMLQPHCHVAALSEKSLQHPMLADRSQKPDYGLTLGVVDIMQAKQIILLINGTKKQAIAKAFFSRQITCQLPASLLWLHPNVVCLIDEDAMGK